MRKFIITVLACLTGGCLGVPEGVTPVTGFELNRYLGTWYEIARLDHPFERGLDNVSATYSLREDRGVNVVNKGFNSQENRWQDATGRAYFVDTQDRGHLKVSFFGPFYGSYIIFELDKQDYKHAFVTSNNRSFLWLLARTPTVDDQLIDLFIQRAKQLGFDSDALIFVDQNASELQ